MGRRPGRRWSRCCRGARPEAGGRMARDLRAGDGNDSRRPGQAQGVCRRRRRTVRVEVAYAELHAHSAHSFLDGASMPEDMVAQARALDLGRLALTDHDGFYGWSGLPRLPANTGCRRCSGPNCRWNATPPAPGVPDPPGEHLLVIARSGEGYRRLCTLRRRMAGGEKGCCGISRCAARRRRGSLADPHRMS